MLTHLLLEDFYALHKVRIALTQLDILLLQQPPGQSAHLPLSTDVGTWTYNDVEAVLLCDTAEFSHVIVAREIKLTLTLFVDIPEDIDAYGIHTQRLAHLDTMLPVGAWDTGVVYFGSLHNERLTVQQKSLVTCLERMSDGKTCKSDCHENDDS